MSICAEKFFCRFWAIEYETLLNKGELRLLLENKTLLLGYHEHRFPLAPKTISKVPTDETGLKHFNANFFALDQCSSTTELRPGISRAWRHPIELPAFFRRQFARRAACG